MALIRSRVRSMNV